MRVDELVDLRPFDEALRPAATYDPSCMNDLKVASLILGENLLLDAVP